LSKYEVFLEKASKDKIKSLKNKDLILKKNYLDSSLPIYFIKLNDKKEDNKPSQLITKEEEKRFESSPQLISSEVRNTYS
jgi:hypothetical protein